MPCIHFNDLDKEGSSCPFRGSCNSCGALPEKGINACPVWNEEEDKITRNPDCPFNRYKTVEVCCCTE